MRARVLGEIDQLSGFSDTAYRSLSHIDRIAHKGNDAAVVIGVHLAVEEIDSVHLHGFDDGVDATFVASFGEVRYTFDECGHKDQDKTMERVLEVPSLTDVRWDHPHGRRIATRRTGSSRR